MGHPSPKPTQGWEGAEGRKTELRRPTIASQWFSMEPTVAHLGHEILTRNGSKANGSLRMEDGPSPQSRRRAMAPAKGVWWI